MTTHTGLTFLLCKALEWESNDPDADIKKLYRFVDSQLKHISKEIVDSIYQMEFIHLSDNINDLTPLALFDNIKIVDFHCENDSRIVDFTPLDKGIIVYVLDYSDYSTINFDLKSNITSIHNINYIKGLGMPSEVSSIVQGLIGYNID